jgi:hypothetical protein
MPLNFERRGDNAEFHEQVDTAITSFPSELLSIDSSVNGTVFRPEDLELKELSEKIIMRLHTDHGQCVDKTKNQPTKEETLRFIELMEQKSRQYSEFTEAVKNAYSYLNRE